MVEVHSLSAESIPLLTLTSNAAWDATAACALRASEGLSTRLNGSEDAVGPRMLVTFLGKFWAACIVVVRRAF